MARPVPTLVLLTSIGLLPVGAKAASLTCSSATTLDGLVTCIRQQMPGSGSGGFVAPTSAEMSDWQSVVRQMLQGACPTALPAGLAGIAEVRPFTDLGNGRTYCVLMETLDADANGIVDRGWGTFITYAAATREISHQAPHPISDSTTEMQAIGVFRDTDSRSVLLAGAHRSANSAASACQSSYLVADAAHNVAGMFHATNVELMAHYGTADWWAVQWHGMAADTCGAAQVYLSHGRNVTPAAGDKILELAEHVLAAHPSWDVEVPGTGACTLNATDNTQGRLINGVASGLVCGTSASTYTGRFLHIEQDPGFRAPADWVQAVKDTWPTGPPPPPPAPAGLAAAAGDGHVTLTWNATPDADTYRVHRSLVGGGPYATTAVGLTATTHTETGLTNGTRYYFVVSAENAGGEGPASSEVSATPTAPAAPAAPANLVAAAAGKKKIALTWTASLGATSYRVKRRLAGGTYAVIASGITATSYTNTGLTSGVTYYYVVTAVNAAGESPPSNEASARAR